MIKKNDALIAGTTTAGILIGAATTGTGGALVGGVIGYLIGNASQEKKK